MPFFRDRSSTKPDPLNGFDRLAFQPEREGEEEHHFGIGGSRDLGKIPGIDAEQQITADLLDLLNLPVVDEEPAAVPERMTVRFLDRRLGRRADVRQEQRRFHEGADLPKVEVVPRRANASKEPRPPARVVPADPEPVSVGGCIQGMRAHALIDERVLGLEQKLFEKHGSPGVGHPTTHSG